MSDINIKWKKIIEGFPKERKYADGRAHIIKEIQKLIEYPNRRMKAIITVMVSSRIRLGSWDYLKLKHIEPNRKKWGCHCCKDYIVYR